MDLQTPPRRYWLSFSILLVGTLANCVFGYLNWYERVEMRTEQSMTRRMLNSRARVQTLLVQAASDGRPLSAAEQAEIFKLWIPAEYDIDQRPR